VNRSGARIRDESGQSLIIVIVFLGVLCAMAGFAIDVGRAYVAYRHLQAAVDSAALAAAQYPDPAGGYAAAKAAAVEYSACTTGDPKCPGKNTYSDLPNVPAPDPVTAQCRNSDGTLCTGTATAMHIEQSASVPLFFAKFLGFDSLKVTAKATALFKGGVPHPLDVMIVTDTTGSMNNNCNSPVTGISDLGFTPTGLDCAKEGIRAFLGSMWPCQQGLPSCGTPDSNGNVPNPIDKVGLMVFPALCTATGSPCSSLDLATRKDRERDCTGNLNNSIGSDVTYDPLFDDYLVVPFSSDFRASDSSPINGDSNLLKSVWWYQCPGHAYPSGSGPSSIGGGPSSSSDRNGASNGSIGVGPSSSSDRNGASNASTIGGGASGSSDRMGASTVGGSIGAGVPNSGSSSSDRNTGQNSSGTTSVSVSRPSNRAVGDFLLATVSVRDMLDTEYICAPSGWTSVRRDTSPSSSTTRLVQETFWRFVNDTSSATYQFTFRTGACPSGGSTIARRATAMVIRYTGVDTANPIDVHNANTVTSAGASLTAPAVTTTIDNDRVVNLYGFRGTTSTTISGTTFAFNNGSSSNNLAMGVEDFTQATAGLTLPGTATSSSSGLWVGQTVALRPSAPPTSITLGRPSNAAAGDFLLVSVTARNLDGGSICPPADGTWTLLRQDTQGPAGSSVTHATFWSVRSGSFAEFYTFAFNSGSCGGAPVAAVASALAVRYTGVDSTAPIDVSTGSQGNTGAVTTINAPQVTTTFANDRVVSLYGSRCATMNSVTYPVTSSGTSTGVEDAAQATPGLSAAQTAASCTNTDWVAHTVALKAAVATAITISRPSNRADGDYLLVSVTARNLDAGSICAPDGSWTLLRQDTQGAAGSSVTHATFWSFRSGTSSESYTFSFSSGSCGGAPVGVPASAVVVRYTGVDPITPIDVSGSNQGNTGGGTTLNAPQVTTTFDNDRVVSLYGSRCGTSMGSSVTYSFSGSGTSTGVEDAAQATAGLSAAQNATSCTNTDWVAHTVALKAAVGSLTISRPSNRADGDFLLVSVTARNLDGASICPPADGSWTLLRQDTQGPAGSSVTHATFWSIRSGSSAESYTFSFSSGSCGGAPVGVVASAVVVRYTGVDPILPIDVSAGSQGNTGAGTTINAPQVTTNFANDRVVSLYGSRCGTSMGSSVTYSFSGSGTSTGVEDAAQAAAGLSTAQTATSCTNTNWVAHTVALRFIGNCSPCDYGVEAGGNTYYTEAIKAAQNELTTNGRPGAQHVIIILGDGEVNTTIAGDTQPCRSAIAASQDAQSPTPPTPPTWVYAIAYDSSGSCSIDSDVITVGSSSSAANSSSGASTLVIAKPSGVANNDVLVASVTVSGGSNTTITAPSGWTQIRRTNNSTTVGIASYYHVVTNAGSEPASYIWSLTSGTRASGGIARYLGVDTSSPIDTSGGGTGSSITPTAPSVTTNGANELVVGLFGTGVSATYTAPSGMTERYAVTNANASGPATEAADYTQATASSTGTKAATASASAGWAAQLVALQPAGLSSIAAVCLMHRIANPSSTCTDNSSNPAERFFNQPTAGDLSSVFQDIANDLTTTRLIDEG
jgi:hypothetical protein